MAPQIGDLLLHSVVFTTLSGTNIVLHSCSVCSSHASSSLTISCDSVFGSASLLILRMNEYTNERFKGAGVYESSIKVFAFSASTGTGRVVSAQHWLTMQLHKPSLSLP